MKQSTFPPAFPLVLAFGDALAIFIVTWIGFGTHGETLAGSRWLTTFLPLCAGWALAAPWLGLYQPENTTRPLQAWRVLPAALLAAPLAAVLRGFLLSSAVLPIFALVLAAVSALGIGIWRLGYAWLSSLAVARKITHGRT